MKYRKDDFPAMELYAQVVLEFHFMNSKPNERASSAAAISLDHTISMSSDLAMALKQRQSSYAKGRKRLHIIHACIRTSQLQRSVPNSPYKTSDHVSRQAHCFELACTQQVGVMSLNASSFAGLECQEPLQVPHEHFLAVINLSPWNFDKENAEALRYETLLLRSRFTIPIHRKACSYVLSLTCTEH